MIIFFEASMIIPKLLSSLQDFNDPIFTELYSDIYSKYMKIRNQQIIDRIEGVFQKSENAQYINFIRYDNFIQRYEVDILDSDFNSIGNTSGIDWSYNSSLNDTVLIKEHRFDFYRKHFPENNDIIYNLENGLKPPLETMTYYGFDYYNNYSSHCHEMSLEIKNFKRNINSLYSEISSLLPQKFVLQLEQLFKEKSVKYIEVDRYQIKIHFKENGTDNKEKAKEKFINHLFTQEYIKNLNITVYEKRSFKCEYKIEGDNLLDRVEGYKKLLNADRQENNQLFLFTLLTQNERQNILQNIETTLESDTFKNLTSNKRRI